jgi:Xaa-Pro aminopeptidase
MLLEPKRLAWGPHGVDFQERVNFTRMREEKAARTRAEMKKRGIAVAILSGGDNIRYTSSMRTAVHLASGRYCLLIFADSNELIFLAPYEYAVHARERSPWIKPENIRTLPGWLGDAGHGSEEYVGKMAGEVILQALKER